MERAIHLLNKCHIDYKDSYDRTGLNIVTPGEDRTARGFEIYTYMKKHNIQNNYVIIDDHIDELQIPQIKSFHILQTSGLWQLGLSPKDAIRFKNELLPQIMNAKEFEN